ncbi:Interleukin-8 [Merluccius polli]|uniref:Interleukin-8 n=1 Tax=Merluccius polli TaxID=89951 RepID=A0AA47MTU1_MERPO|nr:Interleukin-8 [Merluccius polli]
MKMTSSKNTISSLLVLLALLTITEGISVTGIELRCRCIQTESRPIGRHIKKVEIIPANSHCEDSEIIATLKKTGQEVCLDPEAPWVKSTCKDNYWRKLEAKLQQNSVRDVWAGIKHITGMKGKDRQTSGSLDRANQYNQFFYRFSSSPVTPPTPPPPHTLTLSQMVRPSPQHSPVQQLSICHPSFPPTPSSSSTDDICTNPRPTVTTGQVKRQLERLHQRKSAGPDGISPRILKTCASQLSPVLGHLYNLSLCQENVPLLWKTSCLVPVPKKLRPSNPADYRPVALTLHVMKVLERLVLAQLRPQVRTFLDHLQFAYQPYFGVDDAVIYLLQRAHMHLDGGGGTVRIAIFDFSSAFNTIQPLLIGISVRGLGIELRCRCIQTESRPIGRHIKKVEIIPANSHCEDSEIIATLKKTGQEVCLDPEAPWVKSVIARMMSRK